MSTRKAFHELHPIIGGLNGRSFSERVVWGFAQLTHKREATTAVKIKGVSRNLVGIIFYTREVLLTSHYEKRLFDHASQPRVAGADIRLLSYLWSRTNLSRDSYQSG